MISNYPIKIEEVEKDWPGASDRIEIISDDVLKEWREGRSGPWDYFDKRDISGCHIAIDEVHNFCGKTTDAKVRKKWQQFIGELRHQGATIEFLTQAEGKCAKEIIQEAEIRYEIQNGENRRLPVLGYRMGDLYEFRAKLLGRYLCPSYCIEKVQADGKWHEQQNHIFYRLPKYFKYYDSFSAPQSGKGFGNRQEKRPWEKYSWPMLFVWFYLQYPIRISSQLIAVGFFWWFFFMGGLGSTMNKWFQTINGISEMQSAKIEQKKPVDVPTDSSDIKHGSEIKNEKGEVIGRVVKLNKYRCYVDFACDRYFRYDGKEYKVGDYFYGYRITQILPKYSVFILEDLIPWYFEDIDIYKGGADE